MSHPGAIITPMPMNVRAVTSESDGLLAFLEQQRRAVRNSCFGLSEEQSRRQPTPSSLSLGGLVKHLTYGERTWIDRVEGRGPEQDGDPGSAMAEYFGTFQLSDDETLGGTLSEYAAVAAETDRIVGNIHDLARRVEITPEPWLPDPEGCTVRWVVLHLVEETARHAGHADILREALDGGMSGSLMAAFEGWPEEGWIKPWRPAD
jgi:uncharacterized damage-inducible protein DinB